MTDLYDGVGHGCHDGDIGLDRGSGPGDARFAHDGPRTHAGIDDVPGPRGDGPVDVDDAVWHPQERPDSCAVAAQEFVLDHVTGVDHNEADLRAVAEAHGWYGPGGTSMADTGKVLAHYGLDVDQQYGADLVDLQAALARGDGVIVGVDSSEMRNGGLDAAAPLADHIGIPGQGADHAVQVTGVDMNNPAGPQVVVNDPGAPDGAGRHVPLPGFLDAWADSGNFLVTATDPSGSDQQEVTMTDPGDGYGFDDTSWDDTVDHAVDDDRFDPPADPPPQEPDDQATGAESERVAGLQEARLGTAWTVPGSTESGNPVAYSTGSGYYDQKTWDPVEPK